MVIKYTNMISFFSDKKIFLLKFGFITCSETVEHFYNPNFEFMMFDKILKPKAVIAIITNFLNKDLNFRNWFFLQDPKHVVFYSTTTFNTIARQRGWEMQLPARNVVLFKKIRAMIYKN